MDDWKDKAQQYREAAEDHLDEARADLKEGLSWWKKHAKWVAIGLMALGIVLVAYHV